MPQAVEVARREGSAAARQDVSDFPQGKALTGGSKRGALSPERVAVAQLKERDQLSERKRVDLAGEVGQPAEFGGLPGGAGRLPR